MKQIKTIPHEILIKPYTIADLANFYGFSIKSMKRWLNTIKKETGPRMGHYYTPKQVNIIFEEFGVLERRINNSESEQKNL